MLPEILRNVIRSVVCFVKLIIDFGRSAKTRNPHSGIGGMIVLEGDHAPFKKNMPWCCPPASADFSKNSPERIDLGAISESLKCEQHC